jgi:hypothetical protein
MKMGTKCMEGTHFYFVLTPASVLMLCSAFWASSADFLVKKVTKQHPETITLLFIIKVSTAFVGPWPLFQFLIPIHSREDSLDGESARREASTCTKNNTNRINANRRQCLEWDSKPRSQCFSVRPPRAHCSPQTTWLPHRNMHRLHELHKLKSKRGSPSVCLSICSFQLRNL